MIYIIRHGQTDLNIQRIMQGRSNYPLNEAGREQAQKAAAWFAEEGIVFDRVYSSPLLRAMQTAEIICGKEMEIQTDERLLEMEYGPYDGISLIDPPKELVEFLSDFRNVPAPEGMEALSAVVKRTGEFMESIKADCAQGNTLIATHAIAMKGILESLTPEAMGHFWGHKVPNCGIYYTEVVDGVYKVPEELVLV